MSLTAESWNNMKAQLKVDIETSVAIWKQLLTDLGCEYAYAKGSALKEWFSPVDYVPLVSDLDIHFKLVDLSVLDIETGLNLSYRYETEFYNTLETSIHLPRMQMMLLNNREGFIDPRIDQVRVLTGSPNFDSGYDIENLRRIDRKNILALDDYMKEFPESSMERNNLELWNLLRRVCWRVSPIAARIVNQHHDDPIEVFGWNRTMQLDHLTEYGYQDLVGDLKNYYFSCWDLWFDEFKSIRKFHTTYRFAMKIFRESIRIVNTID